MKGLIIIALLLLSLNSQAKDNYVLAFYNTENLFDTLPNPSLNDKDFTPKGKHKWDSDKYNTKIKNICYSIDQISADIIALSEVENENAIRDLVINLKTDYNYLVLENGDKRGINMALLYMGDKFTVEYSRKLMSGTSRAFMLIKGRLHGIPINIIVVHLASNFNSNKYRERGFKALKQYAEKLKDENTIIMGDFNASATDKIFKENMPDDYYNPFREFALRGMGSYAYKDRWLMYDNILISKGFVGQGELNYKNKGILINKELLDPSTGYPSRSFKSSSYKAGYSDHLPVWLMLEK